jgi:hypothetical protein
MARVTLVTGQAQQGKTTLALAILRREAIRGLILDPVRSRPFFGLTPSFSSWDALSDFLVSPAANGKWLAKLSSMEFEDYVLALQHAPCYRHVTLLVDEGLTFASDPEALEPLIRLCRMNAHFGGGIGVPALITAQRPNDLPRDVRSQADRWFSFRQEEPGDLEYLKQRCSPTFADQVAGLGPHQYLTFPVPQGPQKDDRHASGQNGAGVHAGRGGGARPAAHDPAAQHRAEAPRPDGRRLERVKESR